MHISYLNDFIKNVLSALDKDVTILAQTIGTLYEGMSKKDAVELQWCLVELKNAHEEYSRKLRNLDRELEKVEQKLANSKI